MSSVRVVVVQVEGSVEDVVQVCEQLRLSLPAAAPMPQPAPVMHHQPQPMHREPAPMPRAEPARSLEQAGATPSVAPASGGLPTITVASVRDQRRAAADEADGIRDVPVPPHPTRTRRPRHQLIEDLAAIIPVVGDTVKMREFVRDDAEIQILKAVCRKATGDPRFRWMPGIAGGARPARIRRERL